MMIIEIENWSTILGLISGCIGTVGFFSCFLSNIKAAKRLSIMTVFSFGLMCVFLPMSGPWKNAKVNEAKEKVTEYFEKKTGEKVDIIKFESPDGFSDVWFSEWSKVSIKTFEGNNCVVPLSYDSDKNRWVIDTIYKKSLFFEWEEITN